MRGLARRAPASSAWSANFLPKRPSGCTPIAKSVHALFLGARRGIIEPRKPRARRASAASSARCASGRSIRRSPRRSSTRSADFDRLSHGEGYPRTGRASIESGTRRRSITSGPLLARHANQRRGSHGRASLRRDASEASVNATTRGLARRTPAFVARRVDEPPVLRGVHSGAPPRSRIRSRAPLRPTSKKGSTTLSARDHRTSQATTRGLARRALYRRRHRHADLTIKTKKGRRESLAFVRIQHAQRRLVFDRMGNATKIDHLQVRYSRDTRSPRRGSHTRHDARPRARALHPRHHRHPALTIKMRTLERGSVAFVRMEQRRSITKGPLLASRSLRRGSHARACASLQRDAQTGESHERAHVHQEALTPARESVHELPLSPRGPDESRCTRRLAMMAAWGLGLPSGPGLAVPLWRALRRSGRIARAQLQQRGFSIQRAVSTRELRCATIAALSLIVRRWTDGTAPL